MSLSLQQLDAFAELTINEYEKNRWVDIGQAMQRYEFAARVFKDKKIPKDGGPALQWQVQYDYGENTQDTAPYDPDTFNVKDYVTNAQVPWTHQKTNMTWDYKEDAFQSGPTKIISILETRAHAMWMDYFKAMELRLWGKPASSSVEKPPPFGVPYWIVKNATEGFNGGNPSGFAAGAGGIDSTAITRWRNWTFTYSRVDATDLVLKVCRATEKTNFQTPHSFANLDNGRPDWMLYTVYPVWETLKTLQKSQNDDLGPDVGFYKGTLVINGHPIVWVPALTEGEVADSQNPVYGINWNNFKYFYKTGESQKLSPVVNNAFSHTVRHKFLDNSGNFRMLNRRTGGFVGYFQAA